MLSSDPRWEFKKTFECSLSSVPADTATTPPSAAPTVLAEVKL